MEEQKFHSIYAILDSYLTKRTLVARTYTQTVTRPVLWSTVLTLRRSPDPYLHSDAHQARTLVARTHTQTLTGCASQIGHVPKEKKVKIGMHEGSK